MVLELTLVSADVDCPNRTHALDKWNFKTKFSILLCCSSLSITSRRWKSFPIACKQICNEFPFILTYAEECWMEKFMNGKSLDKKYRHEIFSSVCKQIFKIFFCNWCYFISFLFIKSVFTNKSEYLLWLCMCWVVSANFPVKLQLSEWFNISKDFSHLESRQKLTKLVKTILFISSKSCLNGKQLTLFIFTVIGLERVLESTPFAITSKNS